MTEGEKECEPWFMGCDGYDDASYNAGQEDVNVGDMNGDGVDDILDVVLLVNDILSTP